MGNMLCRSTLRTKGHALVYAINIRLTVHNHEEFHSGTNFCCGYCRKRRLRM